MKRTRSFHGGFLVARGPVRSFSLGKAILLLGMALTFAHCSSEKIDKTVFNPLVAQLSADSTLIKFGPESVNSLNYRIIHFSKAGSVPVTQMQWTDLPAPFSWKGSAYPGGGDCPLDRMDQDCWVAITYQPTTIGVHQGSFSLSYFDGVNTQVMTWQLMGEGIREANLRYSLNGVEPQSDPISFGPLGIGTDTVRELHVMYSGLWPATGVTVSLSGSSHFSYLGSTCGSNVTGDCLVTVRYAGISAGSDQATLKMTYNNGAYADTTPLVLNGTTSAALIPAVLTVAGAGGNDFGTQVDGGNYDKVFTVTRTGSLPATQLNGTLSGAGFSFKGGTYPGVGGDCGATLGSPSCKIVVTFRPTVVNPPYAGVLQLTYNDSLANQMTSAVLAGQGAIAANLAITPTLDPADYAQVSLGYPVDKSFQITNNSGSTLNATQLSVNVTGLPYTLIPSNPCGASLAPGANCAFTVRFIPTVTGIVSGAIHLAFFDGAQNQSLSRGLQGEGVAWSLLAFTPGTADFGSVLSGGTKTIPINLSYFGSIAASGFTTTITGAGASAYSYPTGSFDGGGTCLPAGATGISANCTMQLNFHPTAQQSYNATLNLTYNNGNGTSVAQLVLTGSGAQTAHLTVVATDSSDFGTVPAGLAVTRNFKVTNDAGSVAASNLAVTLPNPYGITPNNKPYTLATNTCTGSLSNGQSCTFSVQFLPTQASDAGGNIDVAFNNGVATIHTPFAITAVGSAQPLLKLTPPAHNFGDVVFGATSSSFSVTVNYYGLNPATNVSTVGAGVFNYTGGQYPGTGGTCPSGVQSITQTCTLALSYTPSGLGRAPTTAFTLNYMDGGHQSSSPAVITLDGNGIGPATVSMNPNPSSIDFGQVWVNYPKTTSFSISNTGASDATSMTIASGLAAPFTVVNGSSGTTITNGICPVLPFTLPKNRSCSFTLQFKPPQAQAYNSSLAISYFNGSQTIQMGPTPVTGTGIADAYLVISPTTHDFRNVVVGANSAAFLLSVAYYGLLPATSVVPTLPANFQYAGGSYPGTGASPGCGTTITANCQIAVVFSPTAPVIYNASTPATFSLQYNNGVAVSSQVASTAFYGVGLAGASLSLSPTTFDYGAQPYNFPSDWTFTLKNSAATTVTATSISFANLSAPYSMVSNGCPLSLAPNSQCQFVIRFQPAGAGPYPATVSITYDGGTHGTPIPVTSQLTGTGIATALLTVTPSSATFTDVLIGASPTAEFTVHYYGGVPANNVSISALAAPFSRVGGDCGTSISATCKIDLAFSPTTTAVATAHIGLSYDNGAGQTPGIPLLLTGNGKNPAVLTFGATTQNFGSIAANAHSSPVTVTLTRTGDVGATAMSADALPAPFGFVGGTYPGIGGTCSTALSGSTCTINLVFSPTARFDYGPTPLTVHYFDGVNQQAAVIQLTGSGYTAAAVTIVAGGGTANFGKVPLNGTLDKVFTLNNVGTHSADSLAVNAVLLQPYFTAVSNTCGSSLAAGSSCTYTIRFAPTLPGSELAALEFDFNDGVRSTSSSMVGGLSGYGTVAVQVAANGYSTCGINDAGQVKCWGKNDYGQLGIGSNQLHVGDQPNQMGGNLVAVSLPDNHYAKSVALGFDHTCIILDDDTVTCWGWNSLGQLGLGISQEIVNAPLLDNGGHLVTVALGTGMKAKSLALGYNHSCVLLKNNFVKCWGNNTAGNLGYEDTTMRGLAASDMGDNLPFVDLGGLPTFELTANTGHTCARLSDNTIKCWGNNTEGELGLGSITNRGDSSAPYHDMGAYFPGTNPRGLPPVDLGNGVAAAHVSAGGGFNCAIVSDGSVRCWGRNDASGNLGTLWCVDNNQNYGPCSNSIYGNSLQSYGSDSNQMGLHLPTVNLGSAKIAVAIASGNTFTCALFSDNGFKCWGYNELGELGLGDTVDRGASSNQMGNQLPNLGFGGHTVKTFSVGNEHACAVLDDNTVSCWGRNQDGELGLGDTSTHLIHSTPTGPVLF